MLNKGLEEGRSLLNNPQHTNSLAAEFEAMSENEVGMNTFMISFVLKRATHFYFVRPFLGAENYLYKIVSP